MLSCAGVLCRILPAGEGVARTVRLLLLPDPVCQLGVGLRMATPFPRRFAGREADPSPAAAHGHLAGGRSHRAGPVLLSDSDANAMAAPRPAPARRPRTRRRFDRRADLIAAGGLRRGCPARDPGLPGASSLPFALGSGQSALSAAPRGDWRGRAGPPAPVSPALPGARHRSAAAHAPGDLGDVSR